MPSAAKHLLRKELRLQAQTFSKEQLASWSQQLLDKVERHPRFQAAKAVLLYWSLPDEPFTHDFIKKWGQTKQVFLPIVNGDTMQACAYTPATHLQLGRFDIQEPTEKANILLPRLLDFILVPGTAFDRSNHRMGRGKGYYDRYLLQAPQAFRLGICFPFRILPTIPHDTHDVPMSEVVML